MKNKLQESLNSLNLSLELDKIKQVDWKTQDATEKSVLFYKFNKKDENEYSLFQERIQGVNFAACICNTDRKFEMKNVFSVSDQGFVQVQEGFLNFLYPFDFENVDFVGVTGTNGKTTTVDLVRQLCVEEDLNVLTIGTLGVYKNSTALDNFGLTSPSYIDLRKFLFQYANDCDVVAMELSSHALEQGRIGSIKFDNIGWTNFSQDHLDFHKTMDEYFKAKLKAFDCLKKTGRFFIPHTQKDLIERITDHKFEIVRYDGNTTNPFFKADYNLDNLIIALSLLNNHITDYDNIIEELNPPPGRFNIIPFKENYIVIDYAHTPDAILSISREIKQSFPEHELIVLFGCGGDRDRVKRPLMSEAAVEFSQKVILTSDNPRFEDPQQILDDAAKGLSGDFEIVMDRKEAISKCMSQMKNSVLLIAGKGHEEYLDVKGEKLPYSDLDAVMENIND